MNKKTATIIVSIVGGVVLLGGVFYAMHVADAAFRVSESTTVSDSPVATAAAESITASSAVLYGVVNAQGQKTNYWFEYATDPAVSATSSKSFKSTPKAAAGKGTMPWTFRSSVTGLESGTVYYYRVVAENASGTASGEVVSFKTE